MGKNLKGKELGTGLYQRKDGRYEAKAMIKGRKINLYDWDLKRLKSRFADEKAKVTSKFNFAHKEYTLNQWFYEWFELYKQPCVKENSAIQMVRLYERMFGKKIGDRKLKNIRNVDIQFEINELYQAGKAASTVKDALGLLTACMEAAKNNLLIPINPCLEIHVHWKNKQMKPRFLSKEEQNLFLKNVEKSWYKEMLYIMFLTGMRIGEVGGLMWKDVDFDKKCIHINRSLSCQYEYGNKKMRLSVPKTHNSYRDIPFIGEAEEMYLSQLKKVKELKKTLGKRWRAPEGYEDLVFVTSMGSPVLRYHAEKEIKNIVKAINEQEAIDSVLEQREPKVFEKVYPHAIRHTFCSRCFEVGMQPKVVQKIMGHQHYSTTIDIYTHVTEEMFDKEIGKFGMAMSAVDEPVDDVGEK